MLIYLINSVLLFFFISMDLFNSDVHSEHLNWQIVDDVVMGGRSNGKFHFDGDGHGIFEGTVSIENNGGFSSVRCRFDRIPIENYSKVVLRVKGDGKNYQFRVKTSTAERHSYISIFQTDGSWQSIEIQFNEMYPAFRGRKLAMPNYPGKEMEEIAFLISNKKAESFGLVIDKISLH